MNHTINAPAGERLESLAACAVCGGTSYDDHRVLWPELVQSWGLSADEERYINLQQGTICRGCGANLRSIALARAICRHLGHAGSFDELLRRAPTSAVLEINEAGTLHPRLARLPGHCFACYPEYDMQALSFDDACFDLVVHSDTLEHVPDPLRALRETRRVLVAGGAAAFTVPVILGRLSRSRTGLPSSYHGAPGTDAADLLVHHEFGSDIWTLVLESGFSSCELIPFGYPAGIAILARK